MITQAFTVPSSNMFWYLIHCKPRREQFAANTLRSHLGLSVFLPELRRRTRGEERRTPLFPGYVFAQADLQLVPLSQINSSPGVVRLVDFGDDPQPVPADLIETISARLNDPSACLPRHNFAPGDFVRARYGPLQDLEMIFVGPATAGQRVQVLLHIMGRLKEVRIEVEALEKVSSAVTISPDLHKRRDWYLAGERRK